MFSFLSWFISCLSMLPCWFVCKQARWSVEVSLLRAHEFGCWMIRNQESYGGEPPCCCCWWCSHLLKMRFFPPLFLKANTNAGRNDPNSSHPFPSGCKDISNGFYFQSLWCVFPLLLISLFLRSQTCLCQTTWWPPRWVCCPHSFSTHIWAPRCAPWRTSSPSRASAATSCSRCRWAGGAAWNKPGFHLVLV